MRYPTAYNTLYRVYLTLGYSIRDLDGTGNTTLTMPEISVETDAYVRGLISEIEDLDLSIASAAADSMAVEVGDIKVEYMRHLATLRDLGDSKLQLLSQILDIPIRNNRFTRSTNGRSVLAIRSVY